MRLKEIVRRRLFAVRRKVVLDARQRIVVGMKLDETVVAAHSGAAGGTRARLNLGIEKLLEVGEVADLFETFERARQPLGRFVDLQVFSQALVPLGADAGPLDE